MACGSGEGGGASSVMRCELVSMVPPPRRASAARPGLHHVVDAETEAGEAVEVGLDLHLTDGATVDGHARNAWQCQQMRIDRPVGDVAQRVGIDRVRQQSELEDVHGARGERRELGLRDPHGQLAGKRAETLGNALADSDRIDVAFERYDDDGQPIDGFGAQGFNSRGAVHRRLDGPGDDLLDLLGRKARRLGLNRHLRWNELGENVERRPQREEHAGEEPDHRQRRDDDAVADRPSDERVHGRALIEVGGGDRPISWSGSAPSAVTGFFGARLGVVIVIEGARIGLARQERRRAVDHHFGARSEIVGEISASDRRRQRHLLALEFAGLFST